jgi:hypothetical protein
MRQVLGCEAGLDLADIAIGEAGVGVDGARQEADAERAPGHETDAEFLAKREDTLFRATPQHRVFALDCAQGQGGMRAAQGLQSHLGQSPVQHFALFHQVLDGAGHVFDGHLRVDPVLVQQVDAVGAQALEHALDGLLDVCRPAVQAGQALAGLEIDVPAELRCDHDPVAERRHAFAEYPLHLVRTVSLGRIVEGEAAVEGSPDDVEHFRPARHRGLVGAAHVLDAEADAGDFQRSKLAAARGRGQCRPAPGNRFGRMGCKRGGQPGCRRPAGSRGGRQGDLVSSSWILRAQMSSRRSPST